MDVSNLPGLPLVIAASAAGVAEAVSALLALFAAPLSNVPGLRPTDETRNAGLRALLFALTLAGLVGLAWTQNIVIPRGALPALLATAAGASTLAHGVYLGAKAAAANLAQPQAVALTDKGKAAVAQSSTPAGAGPASATTGAQSDI